MIRTEFTAGAHLPPPGIAFLGFVLLWCTTTTQCTPGKPGSISQTGSSPTNLKGRDSYQSYWAFGGVSSTSQSFRAQDGGKSRHAEYGERNMHSAKSWRSWTRNKDFYAIQLGWVGKCLACKGKCRKTNLKPQPLISMIFTERVREAIAFKAMQSWQTSQHGCGSHQSEQAVPGDRQAGGEHEERWGDLDSSQSACDHLNACHLVLAIADFILMKNGNAMTSNLNTH